MKKSILVAIVVCIALIIIVCLGTLFTKVNKQKPSIDAMTFKNTMEEKGYQLVEAKNQYSEYDYIEQVYLAADSKYKYQIEFYKFSNNDFANQFYNTNIQKFENEKSNNSLESRVDMKNSAKYTLSANGKYIVISTINDTAIFANVDESYKDEVNNILNDFGY